mgnify:CR=1 FL=1
MTSGSYATIAEVAYEGRNLARQTARDIENHEEICAARYAGIHKQIGEIKGFLIWGGGLAFTTILAVLGFLAVAQFNANAKAGDRQQDRIDKLERQLRATDIP